MLVGGLAIYAITYAAHDDQLMVDMAKNLLKGDWLGAYDNRRLIKGITFPLFLAINHITSIPYLISNTALYGLACVAFVKATKHIVPNGIMQAIIFTGLLFIPGTACVDTMLRVYRNSLLPTLVLLVFACFIQMYFSRADKRFFLYSVCAGLAFAAFWNLREDSIWLLPFALAVCMVTAVRTAIESHQAGGIWFNRHILCALLPLLILFGCNSAIKAVNYHYYGVAVRNELSEGGFPELMKAIYAVSPDEDLYRVSVPRSTVNKLYACSPSFEALQPALDANYNAGWDQTDGELDGQIKDGWFFWCLRDCIVQSGYVSAAEINDFCQQAADEINKALSDGILPKREGPVMPSALMSPWKDSYGKELPKAIQAAFWAIARHDGTYLETKASVGTARGVAVTEALTHNVAVLPESYEFRICGWIVSENDRDNLDISVYQGNTLLAVLARQGGQDVYDSYLASGFDLENAKNCRFDTSMSLESDQDLRLIITVNGTEVESTPLTESTVHGDGDGYQWNLDLVSLSSITGAMEVSAAPRLAVLNHIHSIYHRTGAFATGLGLFCYAILSAAFLVQLIRKRSIALLDTWLILTGLVGSVLALCIGIAYTDISAYTAIAAIYTIGGFAPLTAFDLLAILFLLRIAYHHFDKSKQNHHPAVNLKAK